MHDGRGARGPGEVRQREVCAYFSEEEICGGDGGKHAGVGAEELIKMRAHGGRQAGGGHGAIT